MHDSAALREIRAKIQRLRGPDSPDDYTRALREIRADRRRLDRQHNRVGQALAEGVRGSFVALDIERVNRLAAAPLYIGAVSITDGVMTGLRRWWVRTPGLGGDWDRVNSQLKENERPRSGECLTQDTYESAPLLPQLWDEEIAPFIAGRTVVAHNAGLDVHSIRRGFDLTDATPWPWLRFACSLSLARAHPWQDRPAGTVDFELSPTRALPFARPRILKKRYDLQYLSEVLFPEAELFTGGRAATGNHDPAEDAEAAARVVLAAQQDYGQTVEDLLAPRTQHVEPDRWESKQGWVRRDPPPEGWLRGEPERVFRAWKKAQQQRRR